MRRAYDTTNADVTATLQAFLASADHWAHAELYLFGFPFGAPFFGGFATWMPLAAAEVPITWQGFTYQPTGTRVARGQLKTEIGIEVDTFDVVLTPHAESGALDVVPGTTMALTQAARSGLFDYALLTIWRLILSEPVRHGAVPAVIGGVKLFVGAVADATTHRHKIEIRARSRLDLLNQKLPRNVYQPGCLNALFDTVCGLSPTGTAGGNAFRATPTVQAGADTLTVPLSACAQPDGYFDLGALQIGAGSPFQGLRRGIKRYTQSPCQVVLYEPLPFVLAPGQAVTLQAGCDKTLDTCVAKFDNRGRFRGFPYVPLPETAL